MTKGWMQPVTLILNQVQDDKGMTERMTKGWILILKQVQNDRKDDKGMDAACHTELVSVSQHQ